MHRRKKTLFIALAFAMIAVICGVGIRSYVKSDIEAKATAATQIDVPEWDVNLSHTGGTGSMEPTWYGSAYLVKTSDTSTINRFDIVIAEPTDEQRYYTPTFSSFMSYRMLIAGETNDSTVEEVEEGHLLVKRVVGLPGDTLIIMGHHLYVNWELVDEEYDWYTEDSKILSSKYTLDEDEYFIMGDNRTKGGSYDSRSFGAITYDQIINKVIGIIIDVDSETLTERTNDANVVKFAKYDDSGNTYLVDIYGEYGDWEYGDMVAILDDDGELSTYWLAGMSGDDIKISYNRVSVNDEKTDFYETDIEFLETVKITLGEEEYYVISANGESGKIVNENEIVGAVVASI